MKTMVVALGAVMASALTCGCAYDSNGDETGAGAATEAPVSAGSPVGGPPAAPADFSRRPPSEHVFRIDYQVPVGHGRSLHVIEKFSLASLERHPRRGVFMLTGSLVNADQYDAVLDNGDAEYSALDRVARHGYFAASASYEGYDDSSHPADGSVVTAERLLPEVGVAAETFRVFHGLSHVDLLGASVGSSLAEALGGIHSPIDRHHIGRIVVTSHVYTEVTPLFESTFFSPEVHELFLDAPNGYVQTAPPFYELILTQATPDAVQWADAHFPGIYATGPTLEGFDLPIFPAGDGRAPLLQFWGDQDPITPFSDVTRFQADYGGDAELSILPGGGHAPNFEPVRDVFWDRFFAFLDAGDE